MKKKSTRERLRLLLAERALIVGPVTLSNGSVSNHYFDCKKVTLSSEGAELVGDVVVDEIEKMRAKLAAIGGLTTGADPIVGAVMMRARQRGLNIDGFYVRNEAKNHGTRKLVENAPRQGSKVVIVDDVVTLGGSVIKAIEGAEREGCDVVAVITLIDREEGGGSRIKEHTKCYIPLFTLDDFRVELDQKCQQDTKRSERLSEAVSR
jgi:orotate phosphoribosyltransferase